MAAARQEMGPEAMLVNSRKAPPEVRHLGEYEVVFGVVGAAGGPSEASLKLPGEPGESFPSPLPLGDRLSMEVADLKRELEGMRRAITRRLSVAWIGVSPGHFRRLAALTGPEVSELPGNRAVRGDNQRRTAQRTDGPAFQRALRTKSPGASLPMQLGADPHSRVLSPWLDLPGRARQLHWSNSR